MLKKRVQAGMCNPPEKENILFENYLKLYKVFGLRWLS